MHSRSITPFLRPDFRCSQIRRTACPVEGRRPIAGAKGDLAPSGFACYYMIMGIHC